MDQVQKKTTRYCQVCKQLLTKTTLLELQRHVDECDGTVKKKEAKKPAPRPVRLVAPRRRRGVDEPVQAAAAAAPRPPPPVIVHPVLNEHIEKFPVGPAEYCGLVMDHG